jgi:hypothetical protein
MSVTHHGGRSTIARTFLRAPGSGLGSPNRRTRGAGRSGALHGWVVEHRRPTKTPEVPKPLVAVNGSD